MGEPWGPGGQGALGVGGNDKGGALKVGGTWGDGVGGRQGEPGIGEERVGVIKAPAVLHG